MSRREIFVFGSNLSGIHGAGAARFAHKNHGAEWGVGEGLTGDSYALPTKGLNISFMPLKEVGMAIRRFVQFAKDHPELLFRLTPVGCGLAGFNREDILSFLDDVPENVVFDRHWFFD